MAYAYLLLGACVGAAVTAVLAAFMAWVDESGRRSWINLGVTGLIRLIAEAVLVGAAIAALVCVAVIGTVAAWQFVSAYLAVRVIALVFEFVYPRLWR